MEGNSKESSAKDPEPRRTRTVQYAASHTTVTTTVELGNCEPNVGDGERSGEHRGRRPPLLDISDSQTSQMVVSTSSTSGGTGGFSAHWSGLDCSLASLAARPPWGTGGFSAHWSGLDCPLASLAARPPWGTGGFSAHRSGLDCSLASLAARPPWGTEGRSAHRSGLDCPLASLVSRRSLALAPQRKAARPPGPGVTLRCLRTRGSWRSRSPRPGRPWVRVARRSRRGW